MRISTAASGLQPNLRDSGQSDPLPEVRIRQSTLDAGCLVDDLEHLGHAVHDEQPDAEVDGRPQVATPLDRVGVEQLVGASRRRPGRPRPRPGWRRRSRHPAPDQGAEHVRVRVGLDGVVDGGAGEGAASARRTGGTTTGGVQVQEGGGSRVRSRSSSGCADAWCRRSGRGRGDEQVGRGL